MKSKVVVLPRDIVRKQVDIVGPGKLLQMPYSLEKLRRLYMNGSFGDVERDALWTEDRF